MLTEEQLNEPCECGCSRGSHRGLKHRGACANCEDDPTKDRYCLRYQAYRQKFSLCNGLPPFLNRLVDLLSGKRIEGVPKGVTLDMRIWRVKDHSPGVVFGFIDGGVAGYYGLIEEGDRIKIYSWQDVVVDIDPLLPMEMRFNVPAEEVALRGHPNREDEAQVRFALRDPETFAKNIPAALTLWVKRFREHKAKIAENDARLLREHEARMAAIEKGCHP